MPSLEVHEVFLVQCSLVDNQYQQKSDVYTFTYTLLHQISFMFICQMLSQAI